MGCEGSGTIAEVGEGLSSDLIGKKVSFMGDSWGRHAVVDPANLIFHADS